MTGSDKDMNGGNTSGENWSGMRDNGRSKQSRRALAGERDDEPEVGADFALEAFLPYRLAVLAHAVSRALSTVYADRFGLSIAEWRVVANLGRSGSLSAGEVAIRSNLDKPKVTRALKRLQHTGHIIRSIEKGDRRQSRIALSAKGRAVYRDIAVLAAAWERDMLASLSPRQRTAIATSLRLLEHRAQCLVAGIPQSRRSAS